MLSIATCPLVQLLPGTVREACTEPGPGRVLGAEQCQAGPCSRGAHSLVGLDGLQQTVTRQHLRSHDRGTPRRLRKPKEASNPIQRRNGSVGGFLEEVTPEPSLS